MREEGRWEKTLHPLSIRLGFGAALPPPAGLQAPLYPPSWHGFGCVLIAVFLAGHAEILVTVSYEEKNSSWLNFSCPDHPNLNLSNLCAKHHSLMDICRHKFSEVNRKPFFENCNPNPFFFSITSALMMTVLSSVFIYGELK